MGISIKQLLSILKTNGYIKTSDDLGTYFDKNGRKFSCMKHGFNYICYHNIKLDKDWNLVNKSNIIKDYQEALIWVVREVQKYN